MEPLTPHFASPLRFEDSGGLPFHLLEPLVYYTEIDTAWRIEVPAGFATDLASIPRALWNVLPPVGSYDAPAVIHDYLYQTPMFKAVTRAEADAILREAMESVGVGWWARQAIYWGVRVGGWAVWNKYRSQEKS